MSMPPVPSLGLPSTGGELKQQCEQMRRWHNQMYDEFIGHAHDLEMGLRKAGGGNILLFGIDTRIAARRTVRPLLKAAEYNREQAKLWVKVADAFTELFQTSKHAIKRRTIDVSK